jgi:diguanylate cyclase (GGDEF)-like protein
MPDDKIMRWDESVFARALEALPDGVLLVNAERGVIYANPAFAKLWDMPADLINGRNEAQMLAFVGDQLIDPAGFYAEVERIHPTMDVSEDEVYFKTGKVLSRRSVPFEEHGQFQARIWIFTDITEARYAQLDALTGLPNRRAYSSVFPRFMSAKDGGTKSVALLDLDNFKAYNDRYGHAAGDTVLSRVGSLLRHMFCDYGDHVFRIGGEEFLLARSVKDSADGSAHFQAVLDGIADLAIEHAGNQPHGVVTASLGMGNFGAAVPPEDAFRFVDDALYRAKALGRNQAAKAVR